MKFLQLTKAHENNSITLNFNLVYTFYRDEKRERTVICFENPIQCVIEKP